jgi:hypothetical protein
MMWRLPPIHDRRIPRRLRAAADGSPRRGETRCALSAARPGGRQDVVFWAAITTQRASRARNASRVNQPDAMHGRAMAWLQAGTARHGMLFLCLMARLQEWRLPRRCDRRQRRSRRSVPTPIAGATPPNDKPWAFTTPAVAMTRVARTAIAPCRSPWPRAAHGRIAARSATAWT